MQRGEIWLVDLEPVRGSKADKSRPAIVVSNDGANARARAIGRGVISVVPVTSNVARALSFQVLLTPEESGLDRDSKAQAEQVRSLDVTRLTRRVGRVSPARMWELDEALRRHLDL